MASWIKEQHDAAQNGPNGFKPQTKPIYPEIAANAAHALIGVACSLLDRQIAAQAAAFESEGGFTERLHRVRSAQRRRQP